MSAVLEPKRTKALPVATERAQWEAERARLSAELAEAIATGKRLASLVLVAATSSFVIGTLIGWLVL